MLVVAAFQQNFSTVSLETLGKKWSQVNAGPVCWIPRIVIPVTKYVDTKKNWAMDTNQDLT